MGRFLRSKRHRALLWYAADGQCQHCGGALPDKWHADHTIPWHQTHRTNVHELKASCPPCNWHKGGKVVRSFQREFEQLVQDIYAGALPHRALFASVTPGGGKGSLAVILAQLLGRFADKLCVVVPRVTLAQQAEEVFLNKTLLQLFPHTARIRHATNIPNPAKGLEGYSTTYQAVGTDPGLHAQEFARHRYVLLLDEVHHIKTHFTEPEHPEFVWSRAVQPLIDQAALVVYASGTLDRHDKKPIFGLPYVRNASGTYDVVLPRSQTVFYRRQDALHENAIVPLYFHLYDAVAKWLDKDGRPMDRTSFDETTEESGQMLEATLETAFARELLAEAVAHWQAHRHQFPAAKFLVVAPRIGLARRYASWLQNDHGLLVRCAASDDSKDAREAIACFKGRQKPAIDALVTVGMAYEGLDVPAITHIACLTRYRSRGWLEQCFSRAVRTHADKVGGYIFAPDDLLLRQVVDMIRAEQAGYAKEMAPEESLCTAR